jgi:vitamin B12 transporter
LTFYRFIKFAKLLLPLLLLAAAPAWGEEQEDDLLSLVLSADHDVAAIHPRSPRPTSKIAENVTVITAEQIARLNVHTLTEVLNTVPGFQFDNIRTPGSIDYFSMQGATTSHIQLLIDGVPQNEFLEGFAQTGMIPVQIIDRVEIIKGAASAAWGSALGGVINVVTKSPDPEKAASGATSASYGESSTSDLRGELSGTVKRFGYYLSGGNLHSVGLLPNNRINQNNVYAKLVYSLPVKGTITLGLNYVDTFHGLYEVPPPVDFHDTDDRRQYYTFLTFSYPLAERLSLELTGRYLSRHDTGHQGSMTTTDLYKDLRSKESTSGGKARLTWGDSSNNLATGIDFDQAAARISEDIQADPANNIDRSYLRWAAHANGTVTFGKLSILPGVRYDKTGVQNDYWSSTLGATYQLPGSTVLRAYAARGFSLPTASFNNPPQKVTTVQSGLEIGTIPFLWLKGTWFYNILKDIEAIDGTGTITDQIRQGFEVEGRSLPLYGFFLTGGYTYTDIREKLTNNTIAGLPLHTTKIAVNYDNIPLGITGALTGYHSEWNADSNGKNDFVWDLSLTKKFNCYPLAPELFFKGNNLFNGAQYLDERYKSTPRWLEGGVRFKF